MRLDELPVKVARPFPKQIGKPLRDAYVVHQPHDAPAGGFRFAKGGEEVLIRATTSTPSLAILLTHSCEVDNDPRYRVIAPIHPIATMTEDKRDAVLGFEHAACFPLQSQAGDPTVATSYIDFRCLTTVRPEVLLQAERHASLSEETRLAMSQWFWEFLFRTNADDEVALQ
jgi:hypothetical protein